MDAAIIGDGALTGGSSLGVELIFGAVIADTSSSSDDEDDELDEDLLLISALDVFAAFSIVLRSTGASFFNVTK